jgi:CubicO group peptidase (beta-lactamase class C family)
VRFAFAAPQRGWRWAWSSPGSGEQYFIASTTKLYVTVLVMQLRAEGQLDLDAPAARYLDPSVMTGIHVLRGIDAGDRITIRELLSHTSGIADYFEQRQRDGSTQIGTALQADVAWTFADVLRITKEELTPKFAITPCSRRFRP